MLASKSPLMLTEAFWRLATAAKKPSSWALPAIDSWPVAMVPQGPQTSSASQPWVAVMPIPAKSPPASRPIVPSLFLRMVFLFLVAVLDELVRSSGPGGSLENPEIANDQNCPRGRD